MKLKKNKLQELYKFGFEEFNDQWKEDNIKNHCLLNFLPKGYVKTIGSDKGQRYYYHVDEEGHMFLMADKPNGLGGMVSVDNTTVRLYLNGMVDRFDTNFNLVKV